MRRNWRLVMTATLVAAAASAAVAAPGQAAISTTAAGGRAASHSGPFRPFRSVPALGSPAARVVGGPLMASPGIVVSQPASPLPVIPAAAWVVADAGTGQVLAARDPHGEFGPASTLKVLTAVTLIPLLDPDAQVVASSLATAQEPTSAGLITGGSYRVADLFRALLLISANDAAVALTEQAGGGSLAAGMALINAEARHLQAYDVVAKLPNGLPAAGQVVSAYDQALIARQALSMPAFMAYDQTLTSRLELKPGDFETMVNQNYLLTGYPGGIGGKIGWTVASAATYIGMARRAGHTLIVTVLHCTPLQEITSTEKLLDWGFASERRARPVGMLVPPLAVAGGRHAPPAPRAQVSRGAADAAADPGPTASPGGGYALAAIGLVIAGLGLGSLALERRRAATRRGRP